MLQKQLESLTHGNDDKQSRRLIHAYKAASLVVVVIGLAWCGIFAVHQWWLLAFAELVFACIGLASWMLIRAGRLNAALINSELTLLAFAIGFCLMFDVPSEDYPRVSHLYLPVLAMLGYINYVRRKTKIQLVIIAACLAAFIAFSSADLHFSFAQPISDDARVFGTWINSILATLMMAGGILALEREFAQHKGMEKQLRAAVRRNEFELFFQPQIDRAGQVVGAEALMRWKHPQRGYVSPTEFISIVEDLKLMPLVGGWVLSEAARTLVRWADDPNLRHLTLAVNVSASQFSVQGFERSVQELISAHQIDPARLKLELTESVFVSGMTDVVAKMNAMRNTGISFALDDFGTGYSSLSYLRKLPIRQLKIDRSFVQEAVENPRAGALIQSIVRMGRDLDLVVMAEGVETAAQHKFLLDAGCHEFQGYHFGRPVPLETFEDFARTKAATAVILARTTSAKPERPGRSQKAG